MDNKIESSTTRESSTISGPVDPLVRGGLPSTGLSALAVAPINPVNQFGCSSLVTLRAFTPLRRTGVLRLCSFPNNKDSLKEGSFSSQLFLKVATDFMKYVETHLLRRDYSLNRSTSPLMSELLSSFSLAT